jgi:plasmid stabilization system protein ParE
MNAVRSPISKRFLLILPKTIMAQDNPHAAARLAARIEEVAARIAETPYMGEATLKSNFRRFPVGNYLIVYEVGQDEVVVHYIRHGARRRPWEGE